jgi:hypothetical protein
MAEQAARNAKGLTYREIFEQEKVAEYNRRQKLFTQMKYVNHAAESASGGSRASRLRQGSLQRMDSILSDLALSRNLKSKVLNKTASASPIKGSSRSLVPGQTLGSGSSSLSKTGSVKESSMRE